MKWKIGYVLFWLKAKFIYLKIDIKWAIIQVLNRIWWGPQE